MTKFGNTGGGRRVFLRVRCAPS